MNAFPADIWYPRPQLSVVVVVGQFSACSTRFTPPAPRLFFFSRLSGPLSPSQRLGVVQGDEQDSLSLVRGANGPSAQNDRPNLVTFIFQIVDDLMTDGRKDARDVLSHNPSGSRFPDNPDEFGPEVSFIVFSFPLARNRMRLAWKSTANHVYRLSSEGLYVVVNWHPGEVFLENLLTEWFDLAELNRVCPADRSSRQSKSPDTGKQVEDSHFLFDPRMIKTPSLSHQPVRRAFLPLRLIRPRNKTGFRPARI